MVITDSEKLKRLRALDETSFRRDVMVPLLRKMGYESVSDVHGVNEHGLDIIYFSKDKGRRYLCGMQLKVGDIHSNKRKPNSPVQTLIRQAQEALSYKFEVPHEEGRYPLSRLEVFTSGSISQPASDTIKNNSNRPIAVEFFGGDDVCQLLDKYWPDYFEMTEKSMSPNRIGSHATQSPEETTSISSHLAGRQRDREWLKEMLAGKALVEYKRSVGPKFGRIVERYLEANGSEDDQVLTKYVQGLVSRGMKRGTADLHRRCIQSFFRRTDRLLRESGKHGIRGVHIPEVRGWNYDYSAESHRPALAKELIADFIAAARRGDLTVQQVFALALSTTFGMRAAEIAAVRPEDVDKRESRLFIRTAQGGVARWQWLPPEIQPYIPQELEPRDANAVVKSFASMWVVVLDIPRPYRVGWHSIRRALEVDLSDAGVSQEARGRFTRWKTANSSMAEFNASVTSRVTSRGEVAARLIGDPGTREFDRECWDRHPYIGLWA